MKMALIWDVDTQIPMDQAHLFTFSSKELRFCPWVLLASIDISAGELFIL